MAEDVPAVHHVPLAEIVADVLIVVMEEHAGCVLQAVAIRHRHLK
ncbi:MAG: hypothetical protein K0S53_2989, partial [Bacteroidetes bacterium]|nr:hypothetical protein [Bacteroidota bacterium]